MDVKTKIKTDHGIIKKTISEIQQIMTKKIINLNYVKTKFKDLTSFWNTHEEKEVMLPYQTPLEKMPLEHRQLKGHTYVLSQALKSRNVDKIKVAFDTDGQMLFDKLINHIEYESNVLLK